MVSFPKLPKRLPFVRPKSSKGKGPVSVDIDVSNSSLTSAEDLTSYDKMLKGGNGTSRGVAVVKSISCLDIVNAASHDTVETDDDDVIKGVSVSITSSEEVEAEATTDGAKQLQPIKEIIDQPPEDAQDDGVVVPNQSMNDSTVSSGSMIVMELPSEESDEEGEDRENIEVIKEASYSFGIAGSIYTVNKSSETSEDPLTSENEANNKEAILADLETQEDNKESRKENENNDTTTSTESMNENDTGIVSHIDNAASSTAVPGSATKKSVSPLKARNIINSANRKSKSVLAKVGSKTSFVGRRSMSGISKVSGTAINVEEIKIPQNSSVSKPRSFQEEAEAALAACAAATKIKSTASNISDSNHKTEKDAPVKTTRSEEKEQTERKETPFHQEVDKAMAAMSAIRASKTTRGLTSPPKEVITALNPKASEEEITEPTQRDFSASPSSDKDESVIAEIVKKIDEHIDDLTNNEHEQGGRHFTFNEIQQGANPDDSDDSSAGSSIEGSDTGSNSSLSMVAVIRAPKATNGAMSPEEKEAVLVENASSDSSCNHDNATRTRNFNNYPKEEDHMDNNGTTAPAVTTRAMATEGKEAALVEDVSHDSSFSYEDGTRTRNFNKSWEEEEHIQNNATVSRRTKAAAAAAVAGTTTAVVTTRAMANEEEEAVLVEDVTDDSSCNHEHGTRTRNFDNSSNEEELIQNNATVPRRKKAAAATVTGTTRAMVNEEEEAVMVEDVSDEHEDISSDGNEDVAFAASRALPVVNGVAEPRQRAMRRPTAPPASFSDSSGQNSAALADEEIYLEGFGESEYFEPYVSNQAAPPEPYVPTFQSPTTAASSSTSSQATTNNVSSATATMATNTDNNNAAPLELDTIRLIMPFLVNYGYSPYQTAPQTAIQYSLHPPMTIYEHPQPAIQYSMHPPMTMQYNVG